MKQKEIFMEAEGDAWFKRNLGNLGKYDPVTDAIVAAGIKPKYVLEVGCTNGWRLDKLRTMFDCGVMGVEPSRMAAMDAARLKVPVHQMTASCIPVNANGYDMVIYAFCLYLTDPSDWLLIASEGDRALAPGGHLVIHDFMDPASGEAFCKVYEHDRRIRSYHMAWRQLWLAHPFYKVVQSGVANGDEQVVILRKGSAIQLAQS